MKISVSGASPLDFSTSCLILPVWADGERSTSLQTLDQKLDGLISEILSGDGFKAKAGDSRVVYVAGGAASRVILLGLGKTSEFSLANLRRAAARGARAVRGLEKSSFALAVPQVEGISEAEVVGAASEGIELGLHSFDDFKAKAQSTVEEATLLVSDVENASRAVARARAVNAATLRCRHLVNRPSNLKTPEYLAGVARQIAEENGLRVEIWDENQILAEKMGALFGVGMGSDNPPRFIILEWVPEGTENDAPVALVGKGMSFDSGGLSLKPSTSMEAMKDDMAGAGVVLSVMGALKDLNVQKRVLGVIPSAENMVSGRAQRPGDIVTARDGTTIEVLNTDAEGRLILADALVWTGEQNPSCIVDLATLTGAIGTALGQEGAGLFSNDDALSDALSTAGELSDEKIWRLPLWEEFDDAMKGDYSDLKNISGNRYAGSIVAAIFLRHFVPENTPWAHLDIAAVSLVTKEKHLTQKGATGFGVRLLLNWIAGS